MKNLICALFLALCSASALAWPEGNWRYDKPVYDELRKGYEISAYNKPITPSSDSNLSDDVLLAISLNPSIGVVISLKSFSNDFDCLSTCTVSYRFDDTEIKTLEFHKNPEIDNYISYVGTEGLAFIDKIKSKNTLIIEVFRKNEGSSQIKYQLKGFLQPTK